MKERVPKWALVLTLLAALGVALTGLLGKGNLVGLAARPPATATKQPTPDPAWENATLEQIHFGEPKVVFTHNDRIRIHDWLPDNRRLLLEIADPEKTEVKELTERYRVVTLDVETGEIVEYGRRPSRDVRPVWVTAVQGVAYDFYDHWHNKPPEVRLGLGERQVYTIAQADAYLSVDPRTDYLLYLGRFENALYAVDTKQSRTTSALLTQDLPGGQLRVDSTGRWLASFPGRLSHAPLYLADQDKGTVTKVEFDPNPPAPAWWPLEAAWSPDGRRLALALGRGSPMLSTSKLALLDPETLDWHFVDLPVQFVVEFAWGPSDIFILVKGSGQSDFYPNTFWLVNTDDGNVREISSFPSISDSSDTFMAWSENGQLAWRRGGKGGLNIVITEVSLQEMTR